MFRMKKKTEFSDTLMNMDEAVKCLDKMDEQELKKLKGSAVNMATSHKEWSSCHRAKAKKVKEAAAPKRERQGKEGRCCACQASSTRRTSNAPAGNAQEVHAGRWLLVVQSRQWRLVQ